MSFFDLLRNMGATAREMLIAATEKWHIQAAEGEARDGKIVYLKTGKSFTFGELAEAAAKQKPMFKSEKE